MGRLIQAVALGILSAVVLGIVYWGLLTLLKPGLDRIRTALRAERTAAFAKMFPALLTVAAAASVAVFPLSAGQSFAVLCGEIAIFVLTIVMVVAPLPQRH